jgi:hypothetical protein
VIVHLAAPAVVCGSPPTFCRMKQYAAFFEWHDRPRKELGIVERLVESGIVSWRSPQSFSPDPPDCTCVNDAGDAVGVEVVELVSAEAAALNAKGERAMRWWDPGDVTFHVAELLHRKDSKTYHGGPYGELAVCIFTDEPLLIQSEARAELEAAKFGPFKQLTSAYLLFSYVPGQGYPVVRLPTYAAT